LLRTCHFLKPSPQIVGAQKVVLRKDLKYQVWWYIPIIPATQEAEIRRITI
jgi:hypothetical protein